MHLEQFFFPPPFFFYHYLGQNKVSNAVTKYGKESCKRMWYMNVVFSKSHERIWTKDVCFLQYPAFFCAEALESTRICLWKVSLMGGRKYCLDKMWWGKRKNKIRRASWFCAWNPSTITPPLQVSAACGHQRFTSDRLCSWYSCHFPQAEKSSLSVSFGSRLMKCKTNQTFPLFTYGPFGITCSCDRWDGKI